MISDPIPCIIKLIMESGDIQRVKTIDKRGSEFRFTKYNSRVTLFRNRFDLVLSHCIFRVASPCMLDHLMEEGEERECLCMQVDDVEIKWGKKEREEGNEQQVSIKLSTCM